MPHPTSSTRAACSSPSRTSSTKTSHQLSSTGRSSSYRAARRSNPGAGTAQRRPALSCSWRSGRAPALTRVGSPRSRNGTSIDVEVTRQDRRREHLARLARAGRLRSSAARCASARAARRPRHARSRAAWRAVEWPVSRARSRSSSRNVASWTSTSAPAKSIADGVRRSRVPGVHDGPPGPRRPDELLGLHRAPVGEGDRLPALQRASLGPERDAERVGDGRRRSGRAARSRRARNRARARDGRRGRRRRRTRRASARRPRGARRARPDR